MKKLLLVVLAGGLLCSCATKTVSRTELFSPTLATAMDSTELTGMMYYGADEQYDYFTRGISRLRVAKSENAVPSFARFTFNNWQGGKKYSDCLKESAADKVKNWLQGGSAGAASTSQQTTQKQESLQNLLNAARRFGSATTTAQ